MLTKRKTLNLYVVMENDRSQKKKKEDLFRCIGATVLKMRRGFHFLFIYFFAKEEKKKEY